MSYQFLTSLFKKPGVLSTRYLALQNLTKERTLVLSFVIFILLGTVLLLLPFSTNGKSIHFIDALFTATSATCVTGLTVLDTGSEFTLIGQLIILIMIQCGGLGIITFSIAFLYFLEGHLSLGSRDLLFETLSQGPIPNVKSLLKTVFLSTITIEAIGSILLAARFSFDMPLIQAIYYGIFHAVSAFCNAGFSLFSDSFVAYKGDLVVNITLCSLIILGGLGFLVIYELPRLRKSKIDSLSFYAKVVLISTLCLILTGMILLLFLGFNNEMKGEHWGTKLLTSFFQSVTARTAGFNTIELNLLSIPSLFILVLLMFVGASPASCGGGIKNTTFTILMALFKTRFQNQVNVNLFNRRIPPETVSKAISIVFFSLVSVIFFTVLLLMTEIAWVPFHESKISLLEILFEVTSAFATVGLSIDMTPKLSYVGRIVITLIMFMGRLGPLTIAMTVGRKKKTLYKYAQEKVLVG